MRTFAFALGIICLMAAFCSVLEGEYAKACWFLILGLTNMYTATRGWL